ncbi:amino acid adenylation domain-containing protein [Aquimarina muelleri]|uniref:non-ribosomal peptide synthetase n=1 Tax=Aquimarina muelleri TaxID=279356 RepID=UPI003F6863CD
MPLTSNGKLDRKSLPDPDSTELSTKEYVAPRNKIEKKIVAIWQDLLGIERIGVYDNFFELGGHSLLIAQLMSRLQLEGYHIGVKDIFDNPTIVSIVEKLSSVSSVYSVPENGISASSKFITPSMVPLVDFSQSDLDKVVSQVTGGISNIQDIYPLSPLQEGIHFHYLMSDSNQGDPYLLPSLFLFSDQAKRQNFIEALEFVIARHDVLRTCVLSSGLPSTVQVVLREAPLVVEKLILDKSKDVLSQLKLLIAPGNQWMDISKAPLLELKSADDPDNDCYYLILHEHHLILDHVGLEKIVEEVISYSSGDVTNLSAPVLYRNFIGHTLHAQSLNNGESYFRSLLGDIEEPTYPFGLSNVMGDGSDIDELRMFLPKKLGVTLRNASVRLGISPAVFFHAAYGMLIGRCSNKEYAVFGSLFSGRLQGSLGSANSLGLFINTLPVALELKGSVLEFLNQVKVGLEDLLPYEQTPLSHIQGWSGISNEKPLFSALLNYRHSPSLSESESTIDLGLKIIAGQERTNYPFTISVDDYGDDFELKAQVNKSIDASLIIDYLKESLTQLLEGLNDEKINVGNLDIISKKEKAKLLEVFNETSLAYPEDKTVIDLFEEQVIKTPKATAVIFEEKELSYIDLDKRSNQLANYLQNQGVQSGTLVGICLDRSLEVIIAILGILKSGGVYVPLDPEHPKRRTNYMIKDTGIDLVLSSDVNRTILDEHDGLTVLCLDKDWDIISGFSSIRLSNTLSPNDLAYIMYTSGSTGVPKGVMVEHGNIVSLCTSCDYIPLNRDTVWLSTGSISFDATTLEFWGTLLHGGQLVLEDTNSLLDVITLKRLIINHKVTTMWMTASWFHQVVEEDLSVFEPLCHLLVGGDVVLFNYTNKLKERYPELCLINGYGPTENTTFSTVYNIGKETNKNLPIGTPIKNSQVYITDSEMNLLPIGVVGELSVGGSGLSRGYLNESDLTREKFVSNPFIQGERMYKTGDLARWLPDGNLEFMGRIDDQVKIRGYRIELGEIESVLSSLDVVIQCCVLVKEDSLGEKCLVGYVVVEGDLDKEKIQNELKLGLSDYMVPRIWVELDAMPLTSNGKLDRKSLPDPDTTELSTKEYVAPRTQTELRLVAIWQELLGVEQIGIYDNFFELGGHSLLATRLVSMIRKEFEIEIIIKDVFEFVKIEELSTYLEHKKIKERESQNIIYKQIVKI